MRKTGIAAMLFALVVVGCKKPLPAPAPIPVQTIVVQPRDVPIYQQWIGTLDGYPNAQIRAQVTGYLIKQDYKEGSTVKKGALLFEIDPRPFQAVLDQTKAKLAQDQAQQGKTEIDVKRYTPLARQQAVSQEELDNAVQANLAAQATLKADEANIESAQLNLGFCRITSPVAGIAGTAAAQIGDLVGPGSAVLTTVSTVNPIRFYFNMTEQSYLAFSHQYTNAAARAAHEKDMQLTLLLSDGSTYPYPGKWFFTGRQVDVNTGTIQVAALFPNPANILRPGQYGQVRARTEIRHNALAVPQRAVTELQGNYQVITVDSENKAHVQTVQVGEQVGDDWVIEHGLTAGEQVVAEGNGKNIKEGSAVEAQPYRAASSTNSATASAKE